MKLQQSHLFILFIVCTFAGLQGCHSNASSHNNKIGATAYCSQTTAAAHEACLLDVLEEFAIAEANCINIEDETDRSDCMTEANEARDEEDAFCNDSRLARQNVCTEIGENRYDPDFEGTDFVDPLTIGDTTPENPYFPLKQGNVWVYEDGDELITVTVTDTVVEIGGVDCLTVEDVVTEDGELIEVTDDWYAQDTMGNIWYCGELSRNFEDGLLTDLDGSFMHGVDGAKAGILIPGTPMTGTPPYRQEFLLLEAEDLGQVLSLEGDESVEGFDCSGMCLQTRDYSPLEPDTEENKFYLAGVGLIVAYHTDEPDEREELVSFTSP